MFTLPYTYLCTFKNVFLCIYLFYLVLSCLKFCDNHRNYSAPNEKSGLLYATTRIFLKEYEAILAYLEICNSLGNLRKMLQLLVLLVPRLRLEPGTSLTQIRQDITHCSWFVKFVKNSMPCFRFSSRGFRVRACCRASRPSHHHIPTHSSY